MYYKIIYREIHHFLDRDNYPDYKVDEELRDEYFDTIEELYNFLVEIAVSNSRKKSLSNTCTEKEIVFIFEMEKDTNKATIIFDITGPSCDLIMKSYQDSRYIQEQQKQIFRKIYNPETQTVKMGYEPLLQNEYIQEYKKELDEKYTEKKRIEREEIERQINNLKKRLGK